MVSRVNYLRKDGADALRRMLQVVVFCALVAVLTTTIWPRHSYWAQWAQSLFIGLPTWAVIEFGRYAFPARHCHPGVDGGHGWPKGWRGVLLASAGIACGYLTGDALSALVYDASPRTAQDNQIGLVITIAAGGVASFYFHLRGHAAALQASKNAAERDATEARLRLLQSQLEPHMLFNTLANLRALIAIDPPAAQQMVDRMNDYLRATLNSSRATQHPLAAEFERLRDYLELMAIRMGPRLAYTLHLPPELAALPLPPLLLQPLVENAIQHGLEPRVQGGQIAVEAAREGDRLVLTVRDSGMGMDPAAPPRAGSFGLAQVRERVASAYGGRGQVTLQSSPDTGTRVRLELPLAPAP